MRNKINLEGVIESKLTINNSSLVDQKEKDGDN